MVEDGIRGFERAVLADKSDFAARLRLAGAYSRLSRHTEARQHAAYVLQNDRGKYGKQALQIILSSIKEFSNGSELYEIGSGIEEKGLLYQKLTAKQGNITLGNLTAYYELGLADQIIPNPISSQEHLQQARNVWGVYHQQGQGTATADIARYGLTMKDVEKLAGNNDIEIEQNLTENDTIVELVVKPKGFKQTKSGRWEIDYGDGKRHIIKLPEATEVDDLDNPSRWVIWPEDKPPYTYLGIPSGKLTKNMNEAVQSMVNAGIPQEIAQIETLYFWRRPLKAYKGNGAVLRYFDNMLNRPRIDFGVQPDDFYNDIGWLRASRKGTK